MGELSKKIGEHGEKIVLNFLAAIGWSNTSFGIDIPCELNDKHKKNTSEKPRTKHGVDGLFTYETPLFEDILDHIIISVKFSDKISYKKNPNTDFKSYFKDLATALECYEKSEIQNEYSEGYSATRNSTKGLLVWIHNLDENESVVDKISAMPDKDSVYNTIFVLDNKRITFLHICNNLLKIKYQDYNKKFYHIDTGNNPSSLSKSYEGEILPIESIFSDIQIFKLEDKKIGEKVTLVLILNDNFNDNNLRRVIGLAHNLTRNLTASIDIYFPDYDTLHHKNIVAKTKSQFQNNNFTDKINIFSYNNRFQNIGE